MSIELGHFAMLLALCIAAAQSILPLVGAVRGDRRLMAFADMAATTQFLTVAFAFGALMHAFAVSDFSVKAVAAYSHSTKPMLYKLAGTWGNHEGSMLLWVLILAVFGAAVAVFGRNIPASLRARTLAVHGMIGFGFLLFIAFTSNPFERLDLPPVDGQGLNPLLQDPGLAFHPPFLYLGYVGFSMVFSFAIGALLEGRVDPAWARWVRPWTLTAWVFLTIGIGLGSWWAYYELGWGGWWFWDPVENASFMPWLAGTALLHSAIVVEKRNTLKAWTILLAIIAFSLSLIGTFIVRSGVITSVHAFANDPERGVFILALLTIAIGGALTLYAMRASTLQGGSVFRPVSREGALVLNNVILAVATLTVFVGTLYPLILETITGDKISVGAPYFDATFGPLMVPLLLALPVGAMMAWKRGTLKSAVGRLRFATVGAALVIALAIIDSATVGSALGIGLAAWVILGALSEFAGRIKLGRAPIGVTWARAANAPRSVWGMTIAHLGVGVTVAAIIALSSWKTEIIRVMNVGETQVVGPYVYRYDGVFEVRGPNYIAEQGRFTMLSGDREVAVLTPERRTYPVEQQNTTEAGIRSSALGDAYAVIGDPQVDGGRVVRLYHNPLAPWLWTGCLLMALGGGLSLSDRRYRVGAPRRSAGRLPAAGTAAVVLLALGAFLAPSPASAVLPDEILADPVLEERARELGAEIRCLVCRNQSIDDSNAPLARDLRILIRERIVAGDNNAETKAFLVERYGDFVLLKPPMNFATIALWATPLIGLAFAGVLVFGFFRNARPAPAGLSELERKAARAALHGEGAP